MAKQKKEKKSESQSVIRRFLRHRMAAVGFVILLLMTLSGRFQPLRRSICWERTMRAETALPACCTADGFLCW